MKANNGLDYRQYPPAPPRTPGQSPGNTNTRAIQKSSGPIPPPPLTPSRIAGRTQTNLPNRSPGTPSRVRQNPPPPPPRTNSPYNYSNANAQYGLAMAPFPNPPFVEQNAPHPPPTRRHRRNRSYDKPERNRSNTAGRSSKLFQDTDTQLRPDMINSCNDLMRTRSNSGSDVFPRYSRSKSTPIEITNDNYRMEAPSISRSNSSRSNSRKSKNSRHQLPRKNSSRTNKERENVILEPIGLPEVIPRRPDPNGDLAWSESFNENGTSLSDIHVLSHYRDEPADGRSALDRCIDSFLCIFPKVEPLPWPTYFLLSLWCAIPPAVFITFFTSMGFGGEVYYAIADQFGEYASTLAIVVVSYIFVLYMLDADQWNSTLGTLVLDVSVLAIVAGLILLVLLLAYQYPYGMICLFALFNPLWLLIIKMVLYINKSTRAFISWLSGPLFSISVIIGFCWAMWVFSHPSHQWNESNRITAAAYSRCEPNYELYPDCRKEDGSEETCFYVETIDGRDQIIFPQGCDDSCTSVYDDCLNGFILWVGPILVGLTMIFLSFFCTFFREEIEREKDILNFGKIWIFIVFSMWITASLSGIAAGVTTTLLAITLASFVASAMFLAVSFNKEERAQNAAAVFDRLREKYNKHLDAIRGLLIWSCGPVILVYFGLSRLNQFIRKTEIFPCSQPIRRVEGRIDVYTTRTRTQINAIKNWDKARVYTYAVYWGIAFMTLEVIIAKLTVVFLSWLIISVSDFGLLTVTCIIWGAGLIMFLLPPIPGVPVYLTIGIVLPAQGNEILGWIGSIAYSIVIGLLLKLFACAIQQKIIGGQLSHYVKVRQAVGINSTIIRAMRLVVGSDGISWSKVSILIGGPDWPTSVLCGIMRLPLLQILIGTIPVVFLIIPTSLTGTFLYMASIEVGGNSIYPWAKTMATISASFTALVQFGAMIVAAYYLERAADLREEEIENIPIDEDVEQADEKIEIIRTCYREVTQWSELLWWDKLYLRVALVSIVTCSYMVNLFPEYCFETHALTDSIEHNLSGNAANLFLPLGWVAVSMFLLSCLLLAIFQRRCKQKAQTLSKRKAPRRMSSRSIDQQSDLSSRRATSRTPSIASSATLSRAPLRTLSTASSRASSRTPSSRLAFF